LRIRRKSKPAYPREEPLGLNHSLLSDPRLCGVEYRAIERCRHDLLGWRVYYLDPRVAMRAAKPTAEVDHIGVLGEDIAPFLFRLRAEHLGTVSPIEPDRRYRRWLQAEGEFVGMAAKIQRTPEARKLLGAAHVYLCGDGVSPRMLEEFAASGFDRLWHGVESGEPLRRSPETIG
jgi:hypothetical protein